MAAPLVPPEVDLRDYDWFPLFRRRLFASRFHLLANEAEWKAGVILWIKSWDERPAGSLPNDDRELSALSEVRDLRKWKKVKKWAMHGWELADDGRFYHQTVAEMTLDAWGRKEANRQRTAAARKSRWPNSDGKSNGSVDPSVAETTLPRPDILNTYLDSNTPRPRTNGAHPPAEPPWAARLHSWAKGHRWNPIHGPAPDEPGCLAPPDLIEKALLTRPVRTQLRARPIKAIEIDGQSRRRDQREG
ncbi:MAG TPA: hypothetical protein VJ890_05965 [Vineibacter sp.]|nr:hypothetical protein [Vineibacter sp.]